VVDVGDDRLDRDARVDLPELPGGGLGLGRFEATSSLVEEDLALEVVGLDESRGRRSGRIRRPARTRWLASTVPSARKPQIVTRESINLRWPASPSCGKRTCRL